MQQSIVVDLPDRLREKLCLLDEEVPGEFRQAGTLLTSKRIALPDALKIQRLVRDLADELQERMEIYEQIDALLEEELKRAGAERDKYLAALDDVGRQAGAEAGQGSGIGI